jgi:hypothetical protein
MSIAILDPTSRRILQILAADGPTTIVLSSVFEQPGISPGSEGA